MRGLLSDLSHIETGRSRTRSSRTPARILLLDRSWEGWYRDSPAEHDAPSSQSALSSGRIHLPVVPIVTEVDDAKVFELLHVR